MHSLPKYGKTKTYPNRIKKLYQDSLNNLKISSILDWGCSYGDSTNDLK